VTAIMPGNDLQLRLAQIYVQKSLGGGPGFDDNYLLINKRELARAYVAQNRKEIANLYLAHQYAAEHGLDQTYVEQYPEQLALNYVMGHALDLARYYVVEHKVELAEEYLQANQMDLAQSYVQEHEYDLAERCMQEHAGAVLRLAERPAPAKSMPDMTAFLAPTAALAAAPASQPVAAEPIAEIPTLSMLAAGAPEPNFPAVSEDGKPARPKPRVPSRRDLQQRRANTASGNQTIQPAARSQPVAAQQPPAAAYAYGQAPQQPQNQKPAAYSPAQSEPEPDNPYDKPVFDAYGELVDRYPTWRNKTSKSPAQSPALPPAGTQPTPANQAPSYQAPSSQPYVSPSSYAAASPSQPAAVDTGYGAISQTNAASYGSNESASGYGPTSHTNSAGNYQSGATAAESSAAYDPNIDHSDYTGPLPDKGSDPKQSFTFDSDLGGAKHLSDHMPPPLSGSYKSDKHSFGVPWETAGQVPLSAFSQSAPPTSSSDIYGGQGEYIPSSYPPAASPPPGMEQLMSGLSQSANSAQPQPSRSLSRVGLPPPSLRSDGAASEVTSAWF
jgi:hypothetical protein